MLKKRRTNCLFPEELKVAVKQDRIWLKSEELPEDTLRSLYVDLGYLDKIDNNSNHLISGRRGTGKTHLLRAYKKYVQEEKAPTDIAVLSSILDISLRDTPFAEDCSGKRESYLAARNLFDQFLRSIFDQILQGVQGNLKRLSKSKSNEVNNLLTELLTEIELGSKVPVRRSLSDGQIVDAAFADDRKAKKRLSPPLLIPEEAVSVAISEQWDETDDETLRAYTGRINYQSVRELIHKILDMTDISVLHLLIDEWMELDKNTPSYIQNYFAQLLKKTFFNSPQISVVIASVWNQTSLYERADMETSSGIQIGHDIQHTVDLDTSFLESVEDIEQFCKDILFRRLSGKIEKLKAFEATDGGIDENFLIDIFDNLKNYKAYVAASHGIPRDLMKIFKYGAQTIRGDFKNYCLDFQVIDDVARRIYRSEKRETIKPGSPTKHMWSEINQYMTQSGRRVFVVEEGAQKTSSAFRALIDHELIHEIANSTLPRWVRRQHRAYFIDYGNYVDWRRTLQSKLGDLIAEYVLPTWEGMTEDDLADLTLEVVADADRYIHCDACSAMNDMSHPVFRKRRICISCGEDIVANGV